MEERIEQAKAYLRRRLDNELSMDRDIDTLLTAFAKIYLEYLSRGASQDEMEQLIQTFADELLEDCYTLAVDEHTESRDAIVAFVGREFNGMTLQGRIRQRMGTFAGEVALVFLLADIFKWVNSKAVSVIKANLTGIYKLPEVEQAREMMRKGEISYDTRIETPHYGRGVPVSSRTALSDMTRYAIGEGFWKFDFDTAKREGAVGFIPHRGSSYPCAYCDSHAGRYHKIDEEAPAYHNHCVCYVVWIYDR